MNDIPKPKGCDVYWEKWIDAFDAEEEEFDEDIANIEQVLTSEELVEHAENLQSISHIRSIVTPFGVLPLTEHTMASKVFKFWVGHANFKLTKDFYKIIGEHPGIEALDILTPYRFRIAVGKMFVDRDVMTSVRDKMVRYVTTNQTSKTTTDNNQDADPKQI
tara:strand:+ start:499 stop:984 length:486 start_codon:yes stop_codon:yes gene_type:complete